MNGDRLALEPRSPERSRWVQEAGYALEGLARRARLSLVRMRFGDRFGAGARIALEADITWQIGPRGSIWLGPGSTVRRGVDLKIDGALTIGARTLIGPWTVLSALEAIQIGRDVLIAERVSIRDHDHRCRGPEPIGQQGYDVAPVRIGDGCWIGAGAVVCEGIELGEGCVVGANSVVLRSFPAGTILAGAPARPIGQR